MNDQSNFSLPLDPALGADGDGAQSVTPAVPRAPAPATQAFSGEDLTARLDREFEESGPEFEEPAEFVGSTGRTSFDLPSSKDNLIVVLVRPEDIEDLPSQALVEIRSRADGDGRTYRGIVVAGPFYEPDGLRADAPLVVTTAVRGAVFIPRYHGRVMVEVIGEVADDRLVPPRRRPHPNSPVFVLDEDETARVLGIVGDDHDIVVGTVVGHEDLEVRYPSAGRRAKGVLPRHTGILGTTGGGKSTTVSNQIAEWQRAGMAVVLIDTEGEYAAINEPTEDPVMLAALDRRGQAPAGIPNTRLYHLVGREPSNEYHPNRVPFTLPFDRLSPYTVVEILDLTPAQQEVYLKAYEITRKLLMEFKLYGTTDAEREALVELDEMERAFPTLRLSMMYDVVQACAAAVSKDLDGDGKLNVGFIRTPEFFKDKSKFLSGIQRENPEKAQSDKRSWRKVQGSLGQMMRLGIFDNPEAEALEYDALTEPGRVSIIDLGDTDSPQINNLTIAEILRGTFEQQNANYEAAQDGDDPMRRVVVVIEEAHEFLSAERVSQMPVLFQQVARIARRGRKRWLGLVFVTQLPQHLPNEVLGLINNLILHKITDDNVIGRLKRLVGTIDEGLWTRLSTLASGQAVVRMESMTRPLLVAMDPTACKLRMVD